MYSGTTLTPMKWFDAWFGTHQKINRVARRNLDATGALARTFPTIRQIGKFEGLDGPDGIKRKNPGNEPWHFIDPYNSEDDKVAQIIDDHYNRLVKALQEDDHTRAAFEAAWMSHAIVDGLTPAHHYPYEEELLKLRGGKAMTERTTKEQVIIPGDTISGMIKNNWKVFGDKGLLATHFAFEWGVAAIIMPLRLRRSRPNDAQLAESRSLGASQLFMRSVREVADLHMYEEFYRSGWTPRLAKQVRRELAPIIVKTVTLAWYTALEQATGATDQKAS